MTIGKGILAKFQIAYCVACNKPVCAMAVAKPLEGDRLNEVHEPPKRPAVLCNACLAFAGEINIYLLDIPYTPDDAVRKLVSSSYDVVKDRNARLAMITEKSDRKYATNDE